MAPVAHVQAEQKLLCRVATSHTRPKESYNVDRLFESPGWQTLLTIAESSAGAAGNGAPSAAFDAMGIDSPAEPVPSTTDGSRSGGAGGERACPHCTFVNDAGSRDCELCGLPLDG